MHIWIAGTSLETHYPFVNTCRVWDEGKSSGSRASSGRGSSASSCAGFMASHDRSSSRRSDRDLDCTSPASNCRTPPLPPIVTPHGVTFQNNSNGLFNHRQARPTAGNPQWNQNNNSHGDGRVMGRRGPLYYQQQQLQRQQQQRQNLQLSNGVLRNTQIDSVS